MANETEEPTQDEAPEPSSAAPEVVEAVDPEARIAQLEQDKHELHERLLRTAADFENWKKRARREQEEAQDRGREALLRELLPAIDNLERALQHAAAQDAVATGVRMVEKQLLAALEKFGVTRFSAAGKPFDPTLHEAIQQMETSEHPPGTVAMDFAAGYMQGTRLLRPAMVAVAKAPAEAEAATASEEQP